MTWFHGLRHRLWTVLHAREHERQVRQELEFHQSLDEQQQGDERVARRRLGNRTYYQEEVRSMTWLGQLDVLRQDFSYAWRSIRRTPHVTAMVVVTLALGLGANAAVFSVLDRMYLRAPDGVADPDGIEQIWIEHSGLRSSDGKRSVGPSVNVQIYRAIVDASEEPSSFALFDTDHSLYMGQGSDRVRVRGVFASASYFDVLGVRPVMGRVYTAAEDSLGNPSQVVVISDRFWRDQLDADPEILGRTLRIEGEPYTVIGVLPARFTGLDLQAKDVWIPVASIPKRHWIASRARWWDSWNSWNFAAIRRVTDPAATGSLEQRATAAVRHANVRQYGAGAADTLMRVISAPLVGRGPGEAGQDMKIANRLGGVAILVFVIACANVLNLLLARAVNRRREIAVRLALGISRWRLVRLITAETLLLALIAGAAALLVAWWGGSLLRAQLFRNVVWYESALHWRVIAFAMGTAAITGIVAGLVPALQASRPHLTRELKGSTRDGRAHRSRLRNSLVVAQAALSVVLLVGAALFVRSLRNVEGLDLGYDTHRIVYGWLNFEAGQEVPEPVVSATLSEIGERLRTRPGVDAVAHATNRPMNGFSFTTFYWGSDSSASLRRQYPSFNAVSSDFFRAAGLRFVSGTSFSANDGRQVIVNERMSELLWPGREAVGQCIRFVKRDTPCYTVSGVVENARRNSVIEDGPHAMFYLPLGNMPVPGFAGMTLMVRTTLDGHAAAVQEVRRALSDAFPAADVNVKAMTELLSDEYWPWRLGARLFTAFGMLALLVAMIGIYSTVAYAVTQRTHEFGVRSALGARAGDVVQQVIGEGVKVVAFGVLMGIGLALAGGKLMGALLFGVRPTDPLVLFGVSAALLVVAVVATLVPAWRAARVDPVVALKAE
jgi:putative ABC transport system permease protein